MNRSLHYLITVIALLSFSVMWLSTSKASHYHESCSQENENECLGRDRGYRINKNSDVKYVMD